MVRNFLYYLHLIVPIFMISIPLFPVEYLKYLILLPTILYSIWILFNGCPWTKATTINDDEHFILDILRYFKPNLSRRQCNNIIGLVLTFILLISYYKLLYHCNLKK